MRSMLPSKSVESFLSVWSHLHIVWFMSCSSFPFLWGFTKQKYVGCARSLLHGFTTMSYEEFMHTQFLPAASMLGFTHMELVPIPRIFGYGGLLLVTCCFESCNPQKFHANRELFIVE